ncbi:probable ATP-dependent DNA helicase HFM1, partial [Stegodyphus dumicola]|uniref:probable ATP-dependent DNA helicase HFM1 n=1 Tax=Stegodyphus dumicola TaxID=202533 RepID=UPI0015A807F3
MAFNRFNLILRDFQLTHMGLWTKKLDIPRPQKRDEISIHIINDTYVGLDVHKSYTLIYDSAKMHEIKKNEMQLPVLPNSLKNNKKNIEEDTRSCYHKCLDKISCSHGCCKTGVKVIIPKKSQIENFFDQMQHKINSLPSKSGTTLSSLSEDMDQEPLQIPTSNRFQQQWKISKSDVKEISQNNAQDAYNEALMECLTPNDQLWDEKAEAQDFEDDNTEANFLMKKARLKISFD